MSDSTVTEIQTNRQRIFLFTFFSYLSEVFLHYSHKRCDPNKQVILINIMENKVECNICKGKTRAKYSQNGLGRDEGREMNRELSCACPIE